MSADSDVPDIKTRRRAPARKKISGGHDAARAQFEQRAQAWLRERPDRTFAFPRDLTAVVGLGVPCAQCPVLVRRDRQDGHRVVYVRPVAGHWASGITVDHPG